MSAIWHDPGAGRILFGSPGSFSFHELPEIHMLVEIAAPTYAEAMLEIYEREQLLEAAWFKHNAELAHTFGEKKKPWWLT